MRPLYLILATMLCTSMANAAETDSQIDNACLRHAASLVAQLKSDVINNLSQAQSDQALKIATTSCQAYFKKEFSGAATPMPTEEKATVAATQETKKSYVDSFTEKLLNGETVEKDGNKRLKKRR